ncbi:MAG: excinuclease ABC subunit UvrA [Ichthyobacteriaceae bacterium]|nr:excinuclease ABC subunit UvrA [Ichthyobacteriaceae bacterium]
MKFEDLSPKEYILIKGAALHNLKKIDVAIPRNKLVVITGLSGSGKSSLAFDTLYAEGQRRYVESLSSYARQFLGRLNKPQVDYIKGISPAVAIQQKVNSTNPRSTVGTSTEVYDYLKLMFARIGVTYSPVTGAEVVKHNVSDVVDFLKKLEDKSRVILLSPVEIPEDRSVAETLKILDQQGYARVQYNGEIYKIKDVIENPEIENHRFFDLVVDRIAIRDEEDFWNRTSDSIQTAFFEGKGECVIVDTKDNKRINFSNKFEIDGIVFSEPSTHLFSFNNPYGACTKCEGHGAVIGVDRDMVIPNTALSIYEDAVVAWKGDKMQEWKYQLIDGAEQADFPIHKPYFELTEKQKQMLWDGCDYFKGINDFFKMVEENAYKIQYRVMLSRYRGRTICPECGGRRLKPEANYVKVGGKSISELVEMPLDELKVFIDAIEFTEFQMSVAKRLIIEVKTRLGFLLDVGLGYLNLNRGSSTLSGGESQRINLATSLGSSLVGSMYILDEPSIGLHSKDTEKLIVVLKKLRDLGNTVIVVEHDEDIMEHADYIIDIGPEAGIHGGEVVFSGNHADLIKSNSLTSQYLTKRKKIKIPETRRPFKDYIEILGSRENNLKNIDVRFPLNTLTVVTGVSGSGKSSLVKQILYPAVKKHIDGFGDKPGQFTKLSGDLDEIQHVEFVDQNPIGKSSRSNPVTYLKAYDEIRDLFANDNLSKLRGYKPKHFSFNVEGGRCETCKGEGEVTVEMQFMADVHLICEECGGKRFKKEILEIKYQGKSIFDILDMTVSQALEFFIKHKQDKIVSKIQPLKDVGLGYVHLGQPSSTLSGGEAQRVKLAFFLSKGIKSGKTLFIFDEPTTGLHFHDIKKLLTSFNALIEKGNSIVVIEHNLDVAKSADWIIDIGKEGGKNGGNLMFEGVPEDIGKSKESFTAPYLLDKLNS